jgi:putative ABC transport system permease protein
MASNKINSKSPHSRDEFLPKQKIRLWLSALFHVKQSDRELDSELRFHVEKQTEARIRAGLSPQEARQAALREFGSVDLAKEECREERGTQFFEQFWQDMRFGLRMLRKNPGFTAVAVLTLALGIGANTAIFSVVNSVLLRPLPYPEPSQLIQLELKTQRGDLMDAVTVPQFQFFRDHSSVFQSVAGYRGGPDLSLKQGQSVDWITSMQVTDDFFRVLGASPAMGREFVRDETRPGGPVTAILTDEIWRKTFGADPEIVGRQINLDDKSYTVVGVMPRGFSLVEGPADVFIPLHLGNTMGDQGTNTQVLARLKSNQSIRAAQADMAVVYDQFHRQDSAQGGDAGFQLVGYQDSLVSDVKPSLLMLFGAVGFLLLVACANVASLLLARASARQTEISIRLALGARPGRLLRQFITESLLMALLGGVAGLLAATWLLKTLTASIPFVLPSGVSVGLDGSVLAFTFLVAITTSVVFGLASFRQTTKLDLNSSLKESSKGSVGTARNRAGKMLVVVEVTLSVTMLIGAGLLIESLYRLRHQDLGFDPQNVITMTTPYTPPKNTPLAAVWNSQQQIMNRIKALPGVVSVAVVNVPPLVGGGNMPAQREGHNENSIGGMEIRKVSQEFFKTLRIPILQGRGFVESDTESSVPVAVVNENVARKWWNGASPIGDHIIVGMFNGKRYVDNPRPLEVVGVVADVKGKTMAGDAPPTVYLPASQQTSDGNPPRAWVIRTENGANISGQLRAIVTEVNPNQRLELLLSMQQVIGISVAAPNFDTLLMGLFAGLALLLTAVGIYGVLSFTVAQRTHEIGIRMALGARQLDVLRLVVGQGMMLAWAGIGIGIFAAVGLTRFLETLLFNVRPIDAPTYAAVAVALTIVALLASYLPARRATRVDPITALRNE